MWSSTLSCRRDASAGVRARLQQSSNPLGRSVVHAQGVAYNLRVASDELKKLGSFDARSRVLRLAGGAAGGGDAAVA